MTVLQRKMAAVRKYILAIFSLQYTRKKIISHLHFSSSLLTTLFYLILLLFFSHYPSLVILPSLLPLLFIFSPFNFRHSLTLHILCLPCFLVGLLILTLFLFTGIFNLLDSPLESLCVRLSVFPPVFARVTNRESSPLSAWSLIGVAGRVTLTWSFEI
jgi:hypothetical protein